MSEDEPIFSSAGEPGISVRQDDRLYQNAQQYYELGEDVIATYDRLEARATATPQISRIVFRGIVSDAALQDIYHSEYGRQLEVATALQEYGHSGWLIYLAQNAAERQQLDSDEAIITATDSPVSPKTTTLSNVDHLSSVPQGMTDELLELWEEPFGWNGKELHGFARRANGSQNLAPVERDLWFSGAVHAGRLVCASMGERIDLTGREGPLTLVESTEWRSTVPQANLMPATLQHLTRQVARDLQDMSTPPLIYAECNFTSRSDIAGRRAGFTIPERRFAPQIIRQNVTVGDNILPRGLRDFSFLQMPANRLRRS